MKKLILLISVLSLVVGISGISFAAYLTYDENGYLNGVAEFDIEGELYDIEFIQDSYNNIFVNNGLTPFFMSEAFEDVTNFFTQGLIVEEIAEIINVEEWVMFDVRLPPTSFTEDGLDIAFPVAVIPPELHGLGDGFDIVGALGMGYSATSYYWFHSTTPDALTADYVAPDSLYYAVFNPHSPAPVPEPATLLLFGTGLFGLAVFKRKKFKK